MLSKSTYQAIFCPLMSGIMGDERPPQREWCAEGDVVGGVLALQLKLRGHRQRCDSRAGVRCVVVPLGRQLIRQESFSASVRVRV